MTGTVIAFPTRHAPGKIRRCDGAVLAWDEDPKVVRELALVRGETITFEISAGELRAVAVRRIDHDHENSASAGVRTRPRTMLVGTVALWDACGLGTIVADGRGRRFYFDVRDLVDGVSIPVGTRVLFEPGSRRGNGWAQYVRALLPEDPRRERPPVVVLEGTVAAWWPDDGSGFIRAAARCFFFRESDCRGGGQPDVNARVRFEAIGKRRARGVEILAG